MFKKRISSTILACVKLIALALFAMALAGCGPSSEEIERLTSERISASLTAIPTPTSILFPTPLPTSTPITLPPTPTPQPTATPIVLPTPLPTSTPITLPPTPTPVRFPPTPTPQPTVTPQPTTTPQPVPNFNAIYERIWPSVFLIETPSGHGTGWLIEPGLIVTNQHVVAGVPSVTVRQAANPSFTATVLATDSLRDIALLKFDTAQAKLPKEAAPLSMGTISTEDIALPLMALGYSGAGAKSDGTVASAAANVGVLSHIVDFRSNGLGLNLEMDVPVDPGDSGGPMVNPDGLVVGMTRAVMERTTGGQRVVGTFYAVAESEIRAALPILKAGQSR
ncbi:MAG: trypsin-like peptidase domain-containing protein [Chloroflexi bacterium]|nr:trypsin-like peptidase domain-containing protein [Chloroflexota bacterium]